jgi:phage shock protein E
MKNLFLYFTIMLVLTLFSCTQPLQKEHTDLTAHETKTMLETKNEIVILDVRTPAEFEQGHLKGAINLDYNDSGFEKEISRLDTSKTYLLYCASGNRSGKATRRMLDLNFTDVYNSTAGFDELSTEGVPATK